MVEGWGWGGWRLGEGWWLVVVVLNRRWLEARTITHMEEPMLNELGTQETNLKMCLCRLLCAC